MKKNLSVSPVFLLLFHTGRLFKRRSFLRSNAKKALFYIIRSQFSRRLPFRKPKRSFAAPSTDFLFYNRPVRKYKKRVARRILRRNDENPFKCTARLNMQNFVIVVGKIHTRQLNAFPFIESVNANVFFFNEKQAFLRGRMLAQRLFDRVLP